MTPPKADGDADYPRQVGQRIKARRESLGLSQAEFGRKLTTRSGKPVARAQVSRWENGSDLPERSRWAELAAALQTPPEAIFGAMDLEETLAARVDAVEDQMAALISVLGVEEAVLTALRARAAAERRRRRSKEADRLMKVAEEAPRLARKSPRSSRPRRTGS
jgi:transcriptional regulator with XRE-family HTH domain